MPAPFVIGVGNRDRGDDGVGPLVVDEIRKRWPGVKTYVAEGDLSDLAIRWRSDQSVVVVDAMHSGRPVGSIIEIDALIESLPTEQGLLSSHGVGLAEAIELARLLNRLPSELKVIGVEARSFKQFDPVSPEVAEAIEHLASSEDWENGRASGALRPG